MFFSSRMTSFLFLLFLMGFAPFAHCDSTTMLSVMWPKSFCMVNSCKPTIPTFLSIHGLWPPGANCPVPPEPFNISKLQQVPNLVQNLDIWWPNIKSAPWETNEKFWSTEWITHGGCASPPMQLTEYFRKTLALRLNDGGIGGRMAPAKIKPGMSFSLRDLKKEAAKILGKPNIECIKLAGTPSRAISEFLFCVNADGTAIIDCDGRGVRGSCKSGVGLDTIDIILPSN